MIETCQKKSCENSWDVNLDVDCSISIRYVQAMYRVLYRRSIKNSVIRKLKEWERDTHNIYNIKYNT